MAYSAQDTVTVSRSGMACARCCIMKLHCMSLVVLGGVGLTCCAVLQMLTAIVLVQLV